MGIHCLRALYFMTLSQFSIDCHNIIHLVSLSLYIGGYDQILDVQEWACLCFRCTGQGGRGSSEKWVKIYGSHSFMAQI